MKEIDKKAEKYNKKMKKQKEKERKKDDRKTYSIVLNYVDNCWIYLGRGLKKRDALKIYNDIRRQMQSNSQFVETETGGIKRCSMKSGIQNVKFYR